MFNLLRVLVKRKGVLAAGRVEPSSNSELQVIPRPRRLYRVMQAGLGEATRQRRVMLTVLGEQSAGRAWDTRLGGRASKAKGGVAVDGGGRDGLSPRRARAAPWTEPTQRAELPHWAPDTAGARS